MDKSKIIIPILIIITAVSLGFIEYYLVREYCCPKTEQETSEEDTEENIPKGMMILIEYQNMDGLINMVNEMYERGIHGVIYSGSEFVQENCEDMKKLLDYNVEIMGAYTNDPLWGMSYEDQYEALKKTKEDIEACTGQPVRILSSKYQASDENTAKAADALGIPYIVARGTTETEATVYQPEEYNVKILSVSNIPSIRFKYGSLCDYSYWVRGGSPDDMMVELNDALDNNKFTLLSHTRIGGIKERWLDMWLNFFNNNEIEWVSLDEIMTVDVTLPFWQIPQNHNAPYTPDTEKPILELEEESNVDNPCSIDELPYISTSEDTNSDYVGNKIVMFHNGKGSMCLEALEFLDTIDYTIEEHLDSESNFYEELNALKEVYEESEGYSATFGYYPIIFIQDKAYSGFTDEIEAEILKLIEE